MEIGVRDNVLPNTMLHLFECSTSIDSAAEEFRITCEMKSRVDVW
jgi:hypothetical protein